MQGEGYRPPDQREWRAKRVIFGTKIMGTPLACARGGASQEGLVSLLGAERRDCLSLLLSGPALRAGTGPQRWERKTLERLPRGRRLPPKRSQSWNSILPQITVCHRLRLPFWDASPMMEADGYAPSRVSKPEQKHP